MYVNLSFLLFSYFLVLWANSFMFFFLRLILSTTDISSVIAINLWLKRKENKETVWGFEPQVSKIAFYPQLTFVSC